MRTILSFVFALLMIWKVLVPAMLRGLPALPVALGIGCLIIIVTILMVLGWNRAALVSILASVMASLMTGVLAIVFGHVLRIDGTTLAWAESLLYTGYTGVDLRGLIQGAIFLSCSGAILDLSVDIATALQEIELNQLEISAKDLWRSGLTIGRTVVGSQTTTLLLAYMGTYLSIMMVYMAQGTPLMNILTTKALGSEILYTFVGCLGVVMASPLTTLVYLIFFNRRHGHVHPAA